MLTLLIKSVVNNADPFSCKVFAKNTNFIAHKTLHK
jgi:hypothetical protein